MSLEYFRHLVMVNFFYLFVCTIFIWKKERSNRIEISEIVQGKPQCTFDYIYLWFIYFINLFNHLDLFLMWPYYRRHFYGVLEYLACCRTDWLKGESEHSILQLINQWCNSNLTRYSCKVCYSLLVLSLL